MKTIQALLAATAAAALAGNAAASADLAKAKNCAVCHAAAGKLVGPSFKDIAAKYAKDEGAPDRLAQKIRMGSQGGWGAIPMPPNPQVNAEEAARLARWILEQR